MSARIPKGQIAPLNVSQEAQHRVFVGLGWDPKETVSLKDKALQTLGVREAHHDLDLSCYIYDANKRYIGHVSIEPGRETDQTGQIYHSGDNVQGIGDGDDEQISVELKDLDPVIHTLIFKAFIKSGHTFDKVRDPEIRLVDGYTQHEFLALSLADLDDNDKPAFIFAALTKDHSDQWHIRHIGAFVHTPEGGNWSQLLKGYIS